MSLYRDVTDILKENGYRFERQAKGSNEFWCKNGKNCVSVPSNLKSKHTGNRILKDAGINRKI
jgi:predicted RNA binding protein YcfA (HicA-like mRNA interferase family)